ncbi:MAG: UDP-N-acetylmuramate dehydrogenase [Leptospirales bacterium]|nr:UDP-N-acetylmuramate dehydrogenase [Leptospirales bacterium]
MALLIENNRSLAEWTTLGAGGPARCFCVVESIEDLEQALLYARREKLRFFLLGGGSNVVISDRGFDGLAVKNAIGGIAVERRGGAVQYRVSSGFEWDRFVLRSIEDGAQGIECLSGIPGSVGATPIQNVGAYGQEVGETIQSVECINAYSLERRRFSNAECAFGYRSSYFKQAPAEGWLVLSVEFALRADTPTLIRYAELEQRLTLRTPEWRTMPPGNAQLAAVRRAVLELRRSKGMVVDATDPDSRSAGSFFVNPTLSEEEFASLQQRCENQGLPSPPQYTVQGGIKTSAAWLVERAGFAPGYLQGGAGVSSKHSLALVNRGGGSAALLSLAREIQEGVLERFGVRLLREPIFIE